MKFVDRTREISRLQKVISSTESSLIVIYGRRRIGKSTMIRKLIVPDKDIYFQADETQTANQILLLSKSIATVIPGFDRVGYPDWFTLLEAFNYRVQDNATLCLDEFPYLVKSFNALPSVIQRFWDTMSPRFNLILCGSSQQSMYSDLLNEKSPLFGRAACIMKLQPIDVAFMQEAMGLSSAKEAVQNYAFWGGVPRYWKLCMDEGSLENALRNLLLSPDGTLFDEPGRLLRDEMRDLSLTRTLLSTIGSGANRMSEIAGRIEKNASELSGPMRRLIEMGYVEREVPFGDEQKNGKHSVYRIKDPFLDAYYRFVAPNTSLIAMGRDDVVWNELQRGMNAYVGRHWELLCRKAVSGSSLSGVTYGMASRWWGSAYDSVKKSNKSMEIDLIAMSLDKQHLLVGECKWTDHEYADRLLSELKEKVALLPLAKGIPNIHYALFLREQAIDHIQDAAIFLPQDIVSLSAKTEDNPL